MKAQSTAMQRAVRSALDAGIVLPRRLTMDEGLTYDMAAHWAHDSQGEPYNIGKHFSVNGQRQTFRTHDGKTADSTGAFLVGELERLDQTIHAPLASVTWQRDIMLREDVTIADEFSSFTLTNFASAGGLGAGNSIGNGKAWLGKTTDQVGGVSVDTAKTPQALTPWGLEIKYSLLELASAAQMGRPIDEQKIEALKLKHQMDIDEQVYIGDTSLGGTPTGLVNNALMTNVSNVPNGAAASPAWTTKTPAEILADVNALLTSVWTASAFAKMPNKILLPPAQFGYIATQLVSTAGSQSILKYILENNILNASGQGSLTIVPVKWMQGAGAGGTIGTAGGHDRMLAYTQDKQLVRFPMTMLQRTPTQFDSLFHKFVYYCRLGIVELVYPETIGARDEI